MKNYSLLTILSFILGLFFFTLPVSEVYITPLKSLPSNITRIGGVAAIASGLLSFLYIKEKGQKGTLFAILGIILGILATLLVPL